ncbi:MAG: hypothetical protein JRK26_15855 [Deltaproteobacteria bacterium]|nr:hypothetical protein [Deltaproteobacteria bacterium]
MLWVRSEAETKLAEKLSATRPLWKIDPDSIVLKLSLKPAENGKGWRYLTPDLKPLSVTITSKDGTSVSHATSFRPPPYIPSGDTADLKLVLPRG